MSFGTAVGRLFVCLGLLLNSPVMIASSDETIAEGAKVYTEFCKGCHGQDRSGIGQYAGELDDLQRILEGETDEMPDFYGVFSEDEVRSIYAYLTASAE